MKTTIDVRRPAAAAVTSPRFRPDIEGLRAVAVTLVVLLNAGVPGIGGGHLGIDVLFVVSGFLTTSLLLREVAATGRLSVLGFCCRRARRVLPAATLVLVGVVLAGYAWLGPQRGGEMAADAVRAALLAPAGAPAPSPVQHFWPLVVGAQLSFVWPVALAVLLWLGFRWALAHWLAAAVLASFLYSVLSGTAGGSLMPATRAWELGAGALLAMAGDRLDRIPNRPATAMAGVGLAVIVVAALSVDGTTPSPGYAAVPVLATVLVLTGRGDALLGRWPMVWLGRLSYSWYLWHWPVLMIAEQVHGGPLAAHVRAALVLAALGLAAATYFGLEEPVRRSRRLERSPLLTLVLAALLVVTPITVARWKSVTSVPAAHVPR